MLLLSLRVSLPVILIHIPTNRSLSGNLAVGSPDVILPALLKRVPSADTESFRLLSLHALKEVR